MLKNKFYSLSIAIKKECVYSRIKNYSASLSTKVYDFFILNNGNQYRDFFIKKPLIYLTDEDINTKNITVIDYMKGGFPIPIFSTRFVETLQEILKDDLEFYPCKVICEGVTYDFFVGRVLKFLPLIDKIKTGSDDDYGGFELPYIYDYKVFDRNPFYIARDEIEEQEYLVSVKI